MTILRGVKKGVALTGVGEGYLTAEEYTSKINEEVSKSWVQYAQDIEDVYYEDDPSDKQRVKNYEDYIGSRKNESGLKVVPYKLCGRLDGHLLVNKEKVLMYISPKLMYYFTERMEGKNIYKRGVDNSVDIINKEYYAGLNALISDYQDVNILYYLKINEGILASYIIADEKTKPLYVFDWVKEKACKEAEDKYGLPSGKEDVQKAEKIKETVEKGIVKDKYGVGDIYTIESEKVGNGDTERHVIKEKGEPIYVIYSKYLIDLKNQTTYEGTNGNKVSERLQEYRRDGMYNKYGYEKGLVDDIIKGYEKVEGFWYNLIN